MLTKIGYLIPEFPGQTHIFFWRERQILLELGVETDIISTRPPSKGISSHVWSDEARQITTYLAPLSVADVMASLLELLKAGPVGWAKCLNALLKADDVPLAKKVRLAALILVAGKLIKVARTAGWCHVHVHSCADAANMAMFASMLSRVTYSMTLHGPALETYGPNQKQKWKYAKFGLAVSQKLLGDLQLKVGKSLPSDVVMAPMGVNLGTIKREKAYQPWESGICRIFCCGRLNPVKGHKYLIETVELLTAKGWQVQLQIAGEDEQGGSGYHQELNRLIAAKALGSSVELLGAVSEARIRQGLEDAHIFALASLNEGIPVAVMEAMAMEVPVVVTDVGGNAELIDHEIDGILVPPEQPETMAIEIQHVLNDRHLAASLSKACRQKIASQFHHRRSAEEIVNYLRC